MKMARPACDKCCHLVYYMTEGHHRIDCAAYAADEAAKRTCVCCLASAQEHDGPSATAILLAMFFLDKMPPEFYVEALCTAHRTGFDAIVEQLRNQAS